LGKPDQPTRQNVHRISRASNTFGKSQKLSVQLIGKSVEMAGTTGAMPYNVVKRFIHTVGSFVEWRLELFFCIPLIFQPVVDTLYKTAMIKG